MSEPLQALLGVQDADTAMVQLQRRKASLAERRELEALESELAQLGARAAEHQAEKAELVRRQSELDERIDAMATRSKSIEDRLYGARGTAPRDLQAMDDEIRHLGNRRRELEDQELEVMEAIEPIDAALRDIHAEHEQREARASVVRDALRVAEAEIDALIEDRAAERRALAAEVPGDLLSRYEALRARLGGTGAARLVGNRCSGCHLELPAMEVDRIRHLPPGTIVTCEQCGRILVPSGDGDAQRAGG